MTTIEWTDATWNPVRGCSRVSEGCRNCYAERVAARFSGEGQSFEGFARRKGDRYQAESGHEVTAYTAGWTGRVGLIPEKLAEPLRWRKPRRVFVNSMSDLFHEALSDEAIDRVFAVMALAPQHTFQVLTKRAERMRAWASDPDTPFRVARESSEGTLPWPLPGVWLGVSVEDQKTADERIPLLLQTPAAKRFVSAEPLLGPIDLKRWMGGPATVSWVIVGGESGRGARFFNPRWPRFIRDQCRDAGVPFFYKQGGSGYRCAHSSKGGCLDCTPPDLRIREFPS